MRKDHDFSCFYTDTDTALASWLRSQGKMHKTYTEQLV